MAVTLVATALPAFAAADGAVSVDLAEFTVTPDAASVEAGTVDFTVNNVGQFPHELAIVKTDLAADALPLDADSRVDETNLDVVGRVDRFTAADGTKTLSVDLAAGSYVLYCNVGPHYGRGMTIAFDVTAAAAPATTTTDSPAPAASGQAGLADLGGASALTLGLLGLLAVALVAGGRVAAGRVRAR